MFKYLSSLLICICFLTGVSSHAQEIRYDTTYQVTYDNGIKDSVIIITKRVFVTEKVYLVDSAINRRWSLDMNVLPYAHGLNVTSSQYPLENGSGSRTRKGQYSQGVGMNLFYSFNKFEVRTGFFLNRNVISTRNSSSRVLSEIRMIKINDTLDTYFGVTDNSDTIYFHVVEEKDIEEIITRQVIETKNNIAVIYYLEIPVLIAYNVQKGKFRFSFYSGPAFGFFLGASGKSFDKRGDEVSAYDDLVSAPTISLQNNFRVSYLISDRLSFFCEPFYQKHLGSFQRRDTFYNNDFIGIRYGLKFFL
ncbi:MAG: hypothetical protein ACK40G_01640 [Cytophagaceae bacterium]